LPCLGNLFLISA